MEQRTDEGAEVESGTIVGPAAVNAVTLAEPEPDAAIESTRRCRQSLAHRGMVSAEWAVGIIAAIAIAGVLLGVVTSGQVKAYMLKVILTVIGTFAKYTG